MKECFIVVHSNYDEGMTAYAFWKEDEAKKSVNEDVETVVKDLTEQGYKPTVLWHDRGSSVEIYAADKNIYYEWNIIISDIQ